MATTSIRSVIMPAPDCETWWCNTHERRAECERIYIEGGFEYCCDPKLGGIMLPCRCVNITNEIELIDG